jgi:aminoglycoside phosphotransferase (APT) family kinase protein
VGVPVPRSVAVGQWGPGLTFTVDDRLDGSSAERRPVTAAGEQGLAALLSGLRAVPAADVAHLGVPVRSPRPLPELARQAAVAAGQLFAGGQLGAALNIDLLASRPQDRPRAGKVLLHGDLKGEHLLLDEHGAISGVLDWTDAEFGDPATDIAGLAISIGAKAATRTARRAGYCEAACAAGLYLARCDTVIRLDDRLQGADGGPEPLLRRQLARAWQPTALDPPARQPGG